MCVLKLFWCITQFFGIALAQSLNDVCTTSYVVASLPAPGTFPGITIDNSSVAASPVANAEVANENMYPDAVFDYCNVSFAYSHDGRNDQVLLWYWLPAPQNFQNRYLSTGGGGYAINSGNGSLPGGIIYGAAAGATDGGFGSFSISADEVILLANGTINRDVLYAFGYEAIHEMSIIGKQLTQNFFNMSNTKLYSYYQGCSEGGREGWSQLQRFGDQFDGAVTGAPAFRYGQQQVQHLYSGVVEQTMNYFPSPCELQAIVNATIAACDPMDGDTDGVVSRTDLCKLNFNINSTIGKAYYCPVAPATAMPPSPATPVQNGSVTPQGVAVAAAIIDGLHNSKGQRAYLSYQPAATFVDAQTTYSNVTNSWGLYIDSLGGEWVEKFLDLQNGTNLPSLNNVTYDTLTQWMILGWQRYEDVLQTTWPDLTPLNNAGGKVIHYHGESDNSIPTASSVRYWESVRSVMYPGQSYNDSAAALNEWYRLFLVPGAAHCAPNTLQANGPFPQTNLAVLIDWVEKGIVPTTLNATYLAGQNLGQNAQICAWPLRPLWTNNGSVMECQYDQASIDTWHYDMDAYKLPLY
ncbi:feruloyl esterase-like protein B precursor [Exophiala viscosa]|uniref:Carboxylic ester hydrolase n=1 Tax=Exophiala viscosa TaxID=2486360 RepID=A0AAN6IFA5_9EURO|nr:feruloyl esterase-like protein B precursor [Exophiala viscosa]